MVIVTLEELTDILFRTMRQMRDRMHRQRKFDPMSFLQLETLRFIDEHRTPTMKYIARHLCITPPSTTSMIEGLVTSRLIVRKYDAGDRRVVRLAITINGKKILENCFRKRAHAFKSMLKVLNVQERQHFKQILIKMQESYRSHR